MLRVRRACDECGLSGESGDRCHWDAGRQWPRMRPVDGPDRPAPHEVTSGN
jgi:hypothetical protein